MNQIAATNGIQVQVKDFQSLLIKNTTKLKSVLPPHISPEKFMRTIMTAVQGNPELLSCNKESIIEASIKCAKDGLLPDGREAAFVSFNGKVQYIPMYMGLLKRVRNSGLILKIEANTIYENDEFLWMQGSDSKLIHNPCFPKPRGQMIGVYAIAFFKDSNETQFFVMSLDDIEKAKQESKFNGPKTPWGKYYESMAKKTAIRRLVKFLPMDAELPDDNLTIDNPTNNTIDNDNSIETDEPINIDTPIDSKPNKLDKLSETILSSDQPTIPPGRFDDTQGVLDHA